MECSFEIRLFHHFFRFPQKKSSSSLRSLSDLYCEKSLRKWSCLSGSPWLGWNAQTGCDAPSRRRLCCSLTAARADWPPTCRTPSSPQRQQTPGRPGTGSWTWATASPSRDCWRSDRWWESSPKQHSWTRALAGTRSHRHTGTGWANVSCFW